MPLDLYGSNILGPGGNSGIRLDFFNASGCDGSMTATHAIRVVPTPGADALLGLSGLIAGGARRRRRAV
jgi:MYXO-CTERM domain-containing protein